MASDHPKLSSGEGSNDHLNVPLNPIPPQNAASSNAATSLLQQFQQYQHQQDADFLTVCKQVQSELEALNSALQQSSSFNYDKVPAEIRRHTQSLPIFSRKDELVKMLRNNQVVIVVGDTGSGKSTQIPQFLVEAGFAESGIIGITQPRRVAAKALAERVAKESGVEVGAVVGYAVRFDKVFSGRTLIKFMTDGLLVSECAAEPTFPAYSVIIIDEAHERSINTDVCLGLLKRALNIRKKLKVIISSATLDVDRFSDHFDGAPVFRVKGKMHHVDVIYSPIPVALYLDEAANTVWNIHNGEEEGDVLVFLSGLDEIDYVWDELCSYMGKAEVTDEESGGEPDEPQEDVDVGQTKKDMMILPCYGGLTFEEQQRIFEETPKNKRKIILATNIAETSLTIEGIVFVVDTGYFKQTHYNAHTKLEYLECKPITRFQAIQRLGRAGRTRPGKCYRLYTLQEFEKFEPSPTPDILRSNIESVVLNLMSMGISNPLSFEFMNMPPTESVMEAVSHLQEMNALDASLQVTKLGKTMATFPLEPPLSRALVESDKLGCSKQVIQIVAMLSTQYDNLFYRGKRVRHLADRKRAQFSQSEGDYLTLLKIYETWFTNKRSRQWCRSNYIQSRILEEAEEVRVQLREIFEKHRYTVSSSESEEPLVRINIRKAFTSGYFRHVARKEPFGHAYSALSPTEIREVFLHPTSSLFSKRPADKWIIFHEVMVTSKAYMREATVINPDWVREYAPVFVNKLRGYFDDWLYDIKVGIQKINQMMALIFTGKIFIKIYFLERFSLFGHFIGPASYVDQTKESCGDVEAYFISILFPFPFLRGQRHHASKIHFC